MSENSTQRKIGEKKTQEREYRELVQNAKSIILRMKPKDTSHSSPSLSGASLAMQKTRYWFSVLRRHFQGLHCRGDCEECFTIFESTRTAAVIVEEDTTVSLANAEFERLSGYSREDIEGRRSWTQFFDKDDLEKMKEHHRVLKVSPNAAPSNYEARLTDRAGNTRHCLVTVSVIPGTKRSLIFIVDITEHKAEVERIQAAKMSSLHHLVAGVAHQMNNPIGVILSNNDVSCRAIDRIRQTLIKEGPKGIEEYAQLIRAFGALEKMNQGIQAASAEIAGIVGNLRGFVKLDEAQWQFVDIHEGIDNVIALVEPEISGQIRILRDYGDIPRIYCSPSGLSQVFMALLRNAAEAIDGEGRIMIRTSSQEEHIKIEISDTGKGIPKEDIDRIFDPGFTTKGARIGMGLGLPICYQIVVEEHRGHIEISSEPGKGTTLTIKLPQNLNRKKDAV
jgi:PAS domain S-box-containing protein